MIVLSFSLKWFCSKVLREVRVIEKDQLGLVLLNASENMKKNLKKNLPENVITNLNKLY